MASSEGIDCDLDVKLAWSSIRPPAFPLPHQYQSCYCEENVYLLIQALSTQLAASIDGDSTDFVPKWDVRAVFVSNETKMTLLFQQKASKAPDSGWPVVWDYHVFAAVSCTLLAADGKRCGTQTWIYDADSVLSTSADEATCPVAFEGYINATFPASEVTPAQLQPMFRIVPANDFLALFASDRSHMKSVGADDSDVYTWHSLPPSWPLIRGAGAQSPHNLMSAFVNLQKCEPRYGVVVDYAAFCSLAWSNSSVDPGSTLLHAPEEAQSPAKVQQKRPQAGGRVSSSLFPAYLHVVQEHRAHRPDSIVTTPPPF